VNHPTITSYPLALDGNVYISVSYLVSIEPQQVLSRFASQLIYPTATANENFSKILILDETLTLPNYTEDNLRLILAEIEDSPTLSVNSRLDQFFRPFSSSTRNRSANVYSSHNDNSHWSLGPQARGGNYRQRLRTSNNS
jgi:hypothetical protein